MFSFPSILLLTYALLELQPSVVLADGNNSSDFDWDSLTPSTNLTWTQCYSSATQCAKFQVPLDYPDTGAGSAILALIRIPSPLQGSPDYRGPLLFNPGGPGVSGVDFVLETGAAVVSVIGPQFDLLGFDPRGVGRSTPNISFFKTEVERSLWNFGYTAVDVTASEDAIPRHWARAQVLGNLARDRDTGILQHLTTENVARDMMQIVEAHGMQKIHYWGISYGTLLGVTLASIFPDRIERMIIDGVLDADVYYSVDWSPQIMDADKTLQTFFDGCHAAGPDNCAFYAPTPSDIAANLTSLYEQVQHQPAPAYSPLLDTYGIVDHTILKGAIFTSLYIPYLSFGPLAQALSELASGNGTSILQLASPQTSEDVVAVTCTDGRPVDDDASQLATYYQGFANASSFSGIVAGIRVSCSGWKVHPTHFTGPFLGNVSFPILFIGNTADPVTPVAFAHKAANRFPGSVVLTQDSPGHTSFTAPSECTADHVRQYVVNGTLPQVGTICAVNATLFAN